MFISVSETASANPNKTDDLSSLEIQIRTNQPSRTADASLRSLKSSSLKKKSSYRRQFYDILFRQEKIRAPQATAMSSRIEGRRKRTRSSAHDRAKPIVKLKQSPYLRNNCSYHACYAPIRNLLVGRQKFIYSNSTCGLVMPERFCILGYMPSHDSFANTRNGYLK